MDNSSFYDWLINQRNMTHYAAKDVISRCNRVAKLLGIDELKPNSASELSLIKEYSEYSKFVKSQLKRAVILYELYEEYQKANG